ncbi:monomeric sarcosine oxidase-like [Diadema setosum]|uniref:monomeric sarcosine oxidase-like n=1 Tax=Diadema setosum TaxID=31175 RepID=UPI003B3A005D
MIYDVCVVGAGPVGSAAARWTSSLKGVRVCLIGPAEPTEQEWSSGQREYFGEHYGQERLVSTVCSGQKEESWPILARRSIGRFRTLERLSGIRFFEEVGFLFYSTKKKVGHVRSKLPDNLAVKTIRQEDISSLWNLKAPPKSKHQNSETHEGILQEQSAGYINPRKYIEANKLLASRNACELVDDAVIEVLEHDGLGRKNMRVFTKGGREIHARRVLLCAGAFTNHGRLLPQGCEVDISMTTETVAMLEVPAHDVQRLSGMPCMVVKFDDLKDVRNTYFFPPVKYPDGKYCMKVGHGLHLNQPLTSYDDVISWYRKRGDVPKANVEYVSSLLLNWVPDLRPRAVTGSTCVITSTPTGRYYCDMMTPTLGVVVGGNGAGCMIADEIGRMGAQMIVKGSWDHDLPAHLFRARYKRRALNTESKL